MRVSKNCPDEYRNRVESVCVLKNGRIEMSTGKWLNLCKYRKTAESGTLPGKIRIRASVEQLSPRVQEKGQICVSSEKWQNPGEYREKVESVPVSTNIPGEYREKVESM